MVALRSVLGKELRQRRIAQGRTLRDVATQSQVSLGYLSEIERGHKEASSELLASICGALNLPLSVLFAAISRAYLQAEAELVQVSGIARLRGADHSSAATGANPVSPVDRTAA